MINKAAIDGNIEEFKAAVKLGADPLAKDKKGKTPLDLIKKKITSDEFEELAKECLQRDVSLEDKQQYGMIKDYLAATDADENITFLEALHQLEGIEGENKKLKEIDKIYEEYLSPNGRLNLGYENKDLQ